jgi:cell division protein FtsL
MDSTLRDGLLVLVTVMLTLTVVSVVWMAGSIRLLLDEMERNRTRRRR